MTEHGQSKKKQASSRKQISSDQALRDHVIYMLKGEGAHIGFEEAVIEWPLRLMGAKIAKFPHTAWMLVEHMRLAQWDILEFSRNPKHESPKWPEGYWPTTEGPPSEAAWSRSVAAFKKDLKSMQKLVGDEKLDVYALLPWGEGQTVLREALLVADHNAYHLGQLVALRKGLGV